MDNFSKLFRLPRWFLYTLIILVPLFLLLIGVEFRTNFGTNLSYFSPSQNVKPNDLHWRELSPAINPREDAHAVLFESLNLLRDILSDIANDDDLRIQTGRSAADSQGATLSSRDLASAFSGIFSGIGSSIENGVDGVSMYLGIGVGNGTLKGLDPSPAILKANTVNPPATGLNAAAANLGMGLSSQLVGSLNIAALLPSDPATINGAVLALSQGLGSGAASGLMLKPMDKAAFNNTGINGITGNLGQGLTSSFLSGVNINQFMSLIGGNLTGAQTNAAVLSLSQGLGSGAASALKLTTTPATNASFNTDGLNGITGNLGQGLTTSFLQNVDVKALLSNVTGNISAAQVNQASLALAQGLGGGAASALKLKSNAASTPMFSSDGVSGVAGNFGEGLSTSLLQNLNMSMLTSQIGGNITGAQLNQASLSLAQGLGSGAASALNLTKEAADNSSFNTDGINGVAGNFGQGLSTSLLQNVNIGQMLSQVAGGVDISMIKLAAQGLGAGLGEGSVIGLGIQLASDATSSTTDLAISNSTNTSMSDIGPITESFGRGLSQTFLANGTLTKVMMLLGSSAATNLKAQKVASGLAIGLVDGAQQSLQNAGGIGAIINMPTNQTSAMLAMPTSSTFDDSVGGVATGFGNGLGFEAVKGLLQAFGKPSLVSNSQPGSGVTPTLSSNTSLTVRGLQRRSQKPVKQAAIIPSTTTTNNMSLATVLDPILQSGFTAFSCQGIGGLAAIFITLARSSKSTTSPDTIKNLTAALGTITNTTYTTKDKGGNTFTINVNELLLTVNGNSLGKSLVLTVLHLLFATIAYVNAVPAILLLNSARNFALMTGRTQLLPNTKRYQWMIGLGVVIPAMIVTLIFGVLGEGKRSHFYSAHGVMGLFLILSTLLAAVLSYLKTTPSSSSNLTLAHTLNTTLILLLITLVLISGFLDISSISSCLFQFLPQVIFVIAGFLFAIPLFSTISVLVVEWGVGRWLGEGKGAEGLLMGAGRGGEEEGGVAARSGSPEKDIRDLDISKPMRVESREVGEGEFMR